MKLNKRIPLVFFGMLFALLAVILGALGSHYLADKITAEQLASYKTGVQYQMYHAMALIFVFLLYRYYPKRIVVLSGYLFIAGIVLFSGSIYGFTIGAIMDKSFPLLGPLTPLGGLFLIGGWTLLLFGVGWKTVELSRNS